MLLVRILVGLAVLTLGRQLFWLFVAAAGFIYGMDAAGQFLRGQPDVVILVVALLLGLTCAVLAYFLQWAAVAIAGFLVGGRLALALVYGIGWSTGQIEWMPFLVGGIIGALLIMALFDWALIILSSLIGAMLVVEALQLGPAAHLAALIALAIIGTFVQAGTMARRQA